jgi:hypothetical protein
MIQENKNGHLLCWHCGRFDTVTLADPIQTVLEKQFPDVSGTGPLACLACGTRGTREDFIFEIELHHIRPWCCVLCEERNSGEDKNCCCCGAPRINWN